MNKFGIGIPNSDQTKMIFDRRRISTILSKVRQKRLYRRYSSRDRGVEGGKILELSSLHKCSTEP